MEDIDFCMEGAFDLHVHTSPDVLERKVNDFELARLMQKEKMGGFVIKSHHSTTYGRASLATTEVQGVSVFGSIALNNPLGGLNLQAVDTAGRMGAKIIWMPTVDSVNEKGKFLTQDPAKLPYWAAIQKELHDQGRLKAPVDLKDENGNFKHEVGEIIDLIKDYNMILATGHLKPQESIELIKFARGAGLDRIIVTHPEFPTTYFTIEEQKKLCGYGVYFERCYTTPATKKTEWDYVYREISETGPGRNILSTDLGQPKALLPTEGYRKFVEFFKQKGLSTKDIKKMTTDNQRKLLFE